MYVGGEHLKEHYLMYAYQHYRTLQLQYLVANLVVVDDVVYHPPLLLQAVALVGVSSLSCVVPLFRVASSPYAFAVLLFRVASSPSFYQEACLDDDTPVISVDRYTAALFSFAHLL